MIVTIESNELFRHYKKIIKGKTCREINISMCVN